MASQTVIDTLIVQLGLDASKFTEGQRKALEDLRRFQSQAQQTWSGSFRAPASAVDNMTRFIREPIGAAREGIEALGLLITRHMSAATGSMAALRSGLLGIAGGALAALAAMKGVKEVWDEVNKSSQNVQAQHYAALFTGVPTNWMSRFAIAAHQMTGAEIPQTEGFLQRMRTDIEGYLLPGGRIGKSTPLVEELAKRGINWNALRGQNPNQVVPQVMAILMNYWAKLKPEQLAAEAEMLNADPRLVLAGHAGPTAFQAKMNQVGPLAITPIEEQRALEFQESKRVFDDAMDKLGRQFMVLAAGPMKSLADMAVQLTTSLTDLTADFPSLEGMMIRMHNAMIKNNNDMIDWINQFLPDALKMKHYEYKMEPHYDKEGHYLGSATPGTTFTVDGGGAGGTPGAGGGGGGEGAADVPPMPVIPAQYAGMIRQAAASANVPEELLARVLSAENTPFNPNAVSGKGAQGIGQLMPETAARYGVTNPFDPQQSISGAARYLADLRKQRGSWAGALAGYLGGNPQTDPSYTRAGAWQLANAFDVGRPLGSGELSGRGKFRLSANISRGEEAGLADIYKHAAEQMGPGYMVDFTSGYRPFSASAVGTHTQHRLGLAGDFTIYRNGQRLENVGLMHEREYQRFEELARSYMQQAYPEYAPYWNWGRKFGAHGEHGPATYTNADIGHIDIRGFIRRFPHAQYAGIGPAPSQSHTQNNDVDIHVTPPPGADHHTYANTITKAVKGAMVDLDQLKTRLAVTGANTGQE